MTLEINKNETLCKQLAYSQKQIRDYIETETYQNNINLILKCVLFLDELPEFPKGALEFLRQPIEYRYVTISRLKNTITYPSVKF